jgi:hypothetical protein
MRNVTDALASVTVASEYANFLLAAENTSVTVTRLAARIEDERLVESLVEAPNRLNQLLIHNDETNIVVHTNDVVLRANATISKMNVFVDTLATQFNAEAALRMLVISLCAVCGTILLCMVTQVFAVTRRPIKIVGTGTSRV